jgi:radical SAM protein with 4Fe4S-binding SPASM domain
MGKAFNPMDEKKLVSQVQGKRIALHEKIPLATPLVVYIEPSGYCNLKCKFCPHGVDGSVFKRDLMSLPLFKKLIDGLAAFPDKVKLLRVCGNGDSLMNRDLVEMLQYAREKNHADRIELVTNGTLLNDRFISELPKYLDRIICSVEGLDAEDYLRISGVKVDFQRFVDNIRKLYANRGSCKIHLKMHNEAVGDEGLKAKFFEMFGSICDEIFIENLVHLWPQYDTAFSTGKFRWGKDFVRHKVCAQIFKGVQVQADGEVVPCCVDWNRANVVGNLNTEEIRDIWRGDKLRKLQIAHLKGEKPSLEPCKNCEMNDFSEVDNVDMNAAECLMRIEAGR